MGRFEEIFKILGVKASMYCFQLKNKLADYTEESELSFCEHVRDFDSGNDLGQRSVELCECCGAPQCPN